MLELIQVTNDPAFASRCDALDGMRVWVDLERLGKAERQAGRNTFISTHEMADVGRVRAVLRRSRLMVRVNPLHEGTRDEVEEVIGHGADLLMLPMFDGPEALAAFSGIVAGRRPIVPLVETAGALESVDAWLDTPGLGEVYVGLNDLHLSLGMRFMFEPLARGMVARVGAAARSRGLPFGFGGIARLDEGLLPGRDVLGEHLRLGSGAVILSRTFRDSPNALAFEDEVAALRAAEAVLARRAPAQVEEDARRVAATIDAIAGRAPQPA